MSGGAGALFLLWMMVAGSQRSKRQEETRRDMFDNSDRFRGPKPSFHDTRRNDRDEHYTRWLSPKNLRETLDMHTENGDTIFSQGDFYIVFKKCPDFTFSNLSEVTQESLEALDKAFGEHTTNPPYLVLAKGLKYTDTGAKEIILNKRTEVPAWAKSFKETDSVTYESLALGIYFDRNAVLLTVDSVQVKILPDILQRIKDGERVQVKDFKHPVYHTLKAGVSSGIAFGLDNDIHNAVLSRIYDDIHDPKNAKTVMAYGRPLSRFIQESVQKKKEKDWRMSRQR